MQETEFYVNGPQMHRNRTEDFSITLFSRKGILPEADFFHPIPYEPLQVCNAEAIQSLIAAPTSDGLLDSAFELFSARDHAG